MLNHGNVAVGSSNIDMTMGVCREKAVDVDFP